MKIPIPENPNYYEHPTTINLDDKYLRTVIFRDDSGKLVTVDISTIKRLVERYTETSDTSTTHIKGYKDRSWGI